MAAAAKNKRSKESLHDSDDMDRDASPNREEEKQSAYQQNNSKMRSGSTTAGNGAKKFVNNQEQAKNIYRQQNSQDRNEGSAVPGKKGQVIASSGTPNNMRGAQQRSPLKGRKWGNEDGEPGQGQAPGASTTVTESSSNRDAAGSQQNSSQQKIMITGDDI